MSPNEHIKSLFAKRGSSRTKLVNAIQARLVKSESLSLEELAIAAGVLEHALPNPLNLNDDNLQKEYDLGRSLGKLYGEH